MFGSDFLKNAIFVFTKFSQDSRSIRKRANGEKASEQKLIENYTSYFKKDFSYSPDKAQFCFIDNGIDKDPDATENEKKMYQQAIS